jgi:hypothetical protein
MPDPRFPKFGPAASAAIERYEEGVATGPLQDIEGVIDVMRDLLLDAIELVDIGAAAVKELEAEKRSPLGYIAMAREKGSDGPYGILPARNFAIDKLTANMQRERFVKDEDMTVIVAELREVTGDA